MELFKIIVIIMTISTTNGQNTEALTIPSVLMENKPACVSSVEWTYMNTEDTKIIFHMICKPNTELTQFTPLMKKVALKFHEFNTTYLDDAYIYQENGLHMTTKRR